MIVVGDVINSKKIHKLKFLHDSFRFKDSIKEGITVVDKNGVIKDIQALEYFFGVNKEELIGKKYYDIFPEPHDPIFEKNLEEAFEERKLFRFEVYLELEGREDWFLITINPSEDGMSIRFTSINEIKRLEEKIKKVKENYKRILENSGEVIIECDTDYNVKYINAPFFAGYNREEIIGSSLRKFIHPEDLPDFEKVLKERKKMTSTKFRYEQRILSKHGDFLWLNISTTPLTDLNGKFTGIISILSDITYLKETEMVLKDINLDDILMESTGTGIFLLGKHGKIKYSNKQMNDILGDNNPNGKYLDDFMNCSWSLKFKDIMKKWEDGNDGLEELRFNRKDGKIIWTIISSKVVYSPNGKFLGVLGIANDISAQKGLENSLIEREKKLKSTIVEMSVVLNSFIENRYNDMNKKK